MPKKQMMDFGNNTEPKENFVLFEKIIYDRGSKYSVSYGRVENREDIKQFLKKLKSNKKYQKATHNSWAAVISKDNILYETKSDDGETGAGNVILSNIKKNNMVNIVVCVTRWFGGVKLQSDRFKHLQDATLFAIRKAKENQ